MDVCNFPLDMPPNIYHVDQTPFEERQRCIPLPKILSLPEKYHYLYPLTFANSRSPSRCSSVVSNPANSRNETTFTSSDGSPSEKSSGKKRLKAGSCHSEIVATSNVPSTSAQTSESSDSVEREYDNIDEEIEAASQKSSTSCRTVRRKRFHDSSRSWASLIEKVAMDPKASKSILSMEESELCLRMEEFFNDRYFRQVPTAYKRPGLLRVMYQVEDVEKCLETITREDWATARKAIPRMTVTEQLAMRNKNSEELLKSVGIDVSLRKKAVGEKVGKVMREFSAENLAKRRSEGTKRRKLEEDRKIDQKQRQESFQSTIHKSVSARILNKKMRRDEEERSLASTPVSSVHDFHQGYTYQQCPPDLQTYTDPFPIQEQEPVQFHLENDEEHHWGFDLDGLYESIHAENHQSSLDPNDPVEAILQQLDEPSSSMHHLEQEHHANSGDEADAQEEDDDFTGFGDDDEVDFERGGAGNNFDFVNDNFGF